MMKRLSLIVVATYLAAALTGLALEAAGQRTCPCAADCWCKRPGLNVFRWVFPRWHRINHLA